MRIGIVHNGSIGTPARIIALISDQVNFISNSFNHRDHMTRRAKAK